MKRSDGKSDDLAQIAAILATGYLKLRAESAKPPSRAKLRLPESVLSPCYDQRPEA